MTPTLVSSLPSLEGTVTMLAALTSLALAAAGLARRPRGRLRWSFALGMLGLALESASAFVLLTWTDDPADRLLWLRISEALRLLVLVPWGVFVVALGQPGSRRLPPSLRRALVGGGVALIAAATAFLVLEVFEIADVDGPFHAARVAFLGRTGIVLELVATIAILAALEGALRASSSEARWRTKYLILGLGGIFLARFYLLSQVALFNVLLATHVSTAAATQVIGNVVIGLSLARNLLGSELALSRRVLYRSAAVAVLGSYLVALALLGLVFNRLGIAQELFWGSIVVFISALALASAMLSSAIRWRIKKFVGANFYRTKYDYREQWAHFTKRLGSLLTVDDLTPALLSTVVEIVGATAGRLFLEDAKNGRYHAVAVVGLGAADYSLEPGCPLVSALVVGKRPIVVGEDWPADRLGFPPRDELGDGAIVVPLCWRGGLAGIMVVGPERTGAGYTGEDLEFVATVAEQAAGAITTAQLSESLAQAREFEAFTRLTSFVIHDLKNSISALSMLSDNALKHFDDPEFQRDALRTLARTVERMKALMGRLAAPDAHALHFQPVDVTALAAEASRPLARGTRVSLIPDLVPVPLVPGDPDALLKVFQNLVTNAAQSIEGEGAVTVRTYVEEGQVVLSVSDTGCGMSEEFIRRSLFSPFRSTKKGGWGIGLYQAKGIVEAHRGAIDAVSKSGTGTTFRVSLPAPAREVA